MLIQRGFKYRLSPTKEQEHRLLQQGGNARFIWNFFLRQNMNQYKEDKTFKFYSELASALPQLKVEYPFLTESFSQSLQMVARQLDKALRDSFKKEKGFPTFKHKSLFQDSFSCPQKWRLGKGFVFIPKIGEVKWVKHRPMKGRPKSITISQDGTKWYCSVLCEYEVKEQELKTDSIVGIDMGLKEFATLSDGTVVNNPRHLKQYEKKLAKEQRELSRKEKGSRNRNRQRQKVRKIHEKIKNVRKDFLHKTSDLIAKNYDGVVLETLCVKGMLKNHCLAKAISDVSWSEFKRQLEYKCLWNFKCFIQIGRFEPSTKTCSMCGNIQDMPLEQRQYNCTKCGFSMNRDLNAANNIKKMGLNTLGRRGINACGVVSVETTEKQEKECLEN